MGAKIKYRSYADEYTPSDIVEMVLKKKSHTKSKPPCPKCNTKIYVKAYYVGLRDAPKLIMIGDSVPEWERGAPLTCIGEGYGWDCARCMIIFSDSKRINSKSSS